MQNSGNAPIKLPTRRFTLDQFDRLPREVRDALNYAAFKYGWTGRIVNAKAAAAAIRDVDEKAVAAAYSQREALDDLRDLGL